jgi:hypothetical protein
LSKTQEKSFVPSQKFELKSNLGNPFLRPSCIPNKADVYKKGGVNQN